MSTWRRSFLTSSAISLTLTRMDCLCRAILCIGSRNPADTFCQIILHYLITLHSSKVFSNVVVFNGDSTNSVMVTCSLYGVRFLSCPHHTLMVLLLLHPQWHCVQCGLAHMYICMDICISVLVIHRFLLPRTSVWGGSLVRSRTPYPQLCIHFEAAIVRACILFYTADSRLFQPQRNSRHWYGVRSYWFCIFIFSDAKVIESVEISFT
jgi:hypothetical protein